MINPAYQSHPIHSDCVDRAIVSRRSVRAFLSTPVPRSTVEHLLQVAARAPSGTNTQPWRTYVCTGVTLQNLVNRVCNAYEHESDEHGNEFDYYPAPFAEPYLSRRRKLGWDLYGLLGIERGQKDKMHRQHARNFAFFDAPVGMIVTADRALKIGSWLDIGMFIQNVAIAARGHELHTCPQAAWATYHRAIREVLPIPDNEVVVCGIALGHIDPDAIVNTLQTERAPLRDFAQFFE